MRAKLVIFDNDGVLVDSEPLSKEAHRAASLPQGAKIDESWFYANVLGMRNSDILKTIELATGVSLDREKYNEIYVRTYEKLIDTQLKATPHIAEALERVIKIVPICVASSGTLPFTFRKLKAAGLTKYFKTEAVFSGTQVKNGKPAPDLFLLAAKSMGVEPKDCVVVEDSPYGVRAARAAGMFTIGYLGGSHVPLAPGLTPETLYKEGADVVISDHLALLAEIK